MVPRFGAKYVAALEVLKVAIPAEILLWLMLRISNEGSSMEKFLLILSAIVPVIGILLILRILFWDTMKKNQSTLVVALLMLAGFELILWLAYEDGRFQPGTWILVGIGFPVVIIGFTLWKYSRH